MGKNCENCVYYGTDRTDQPCCCCDFEKINFEKYKDDEE